MIRILIILLMITAMCGCSTTATKFIDTDGTVYSATTIAGPFAKTDKTAHQFQYVWKAGTGQISVGQDSAGMDNTRQVEGIPATITATGAAIGAALQAAAKTQALGTASATTAAIEGLK